MTEPINGEGKEPMVPKTGEVITPQAPATPVPPAPPQQPEDKVTLTRAELETLKSQARLGEKSEHLFQKTRDLKRRLYSEKPEAAKAQDNEELQTAKNVAQDLIMSKPEYAKLVSENPYLRQAILRNPFDLVPPGETIYDESDLRETLSHVLDTEALKFVTPKPGNNSPDSKPVPTPTTPPSDSTPNAPTPPPGRPASLSESHREPMKRAENSIAERIRRGDNLRR